MKFTAVIFDMDGVIIDSEHLHSQCTMDALKDFGVEVTVKEMEKYVGVADHVMMDLLIEEFSIEATADLLLTRQHEKRASVFHGENMVPVAGIIELIPFLYNKGIKIGLASSASKQLIELVLRSFDLFKHFQTLVSGEELERSKPYPDIYLKAAEQLGVQPADCMAIDDSNAGVRSAKAAGMYTIGYQNPNSGKQDLSIADRIIEDMEQLRGFFES